MRDPIEAVADHVIATQLRDIPEPATKSAKTFLLDTIGVALAGTRDPYVKNLLSHAANNGGAKTSRVIGQRVNLAPADAAIVNGYQIHNSEFDCIHEEAVVHTMSVLLASVLADADCRGGRCAVQPLDRIAVRPDGRVCRAARHPCDQPRRSADCRDDQRTPLAEIDTTGSRTGGRCASCGGGSAGSRS